MLSSPTPFRLEPGRLASQLEQFNSRKEIEWFGFLGAFEAPGYAVVSIARLDPGMLGGGGAAAINGGVIAAGFDGAFVLAGLGQYESRVVVTIELSVKFLNLAIASKPLQWRAHVVRSSKRFAFAEGALVERDDANQRALAIAMAMVAPAG